MQRELHHFAMSDCSVQMRLHGLTKFGRSSERWHVGDAWAQRGDEGRGKLR
jgi:hypothetical protein